MNKPQATGLIQLAVEIVLILSLGQLAIRLALTTLEISLSGPVSAMVEAILLSLVCAPLILWRLSTQNSGIHANPAMNPVAQPRMIAASAQRALHGALVVFVLGCGLSIFTAYRMYQDVRQDAERRFDQQVQLLAEAVQVRFEQPVLALKSLSGIYATDQGFSRQKFRAYWTARGFASDYPGVRGFGYIQRVSREDVPRFLLAERRDHAPDFSIKPAGTARELNVITLIEPLENNRQALGLDISFESVRRTAAERAARTGDATLSGVITLVQDGRQGPGFLLLLPLYRHTVDVGNEASRLAHHAGFVFSPIVADELLGGTVAMTLGLSHFELFAAATAEPGKMVFDSQTRDPSQARPSREHAAAEHVYEVSHPMSMGDQSFTLRVRSTPAFEATVDTAAPMLVGSSGTLFSALVALMLWLLAAGRARAEARAQELTSDLQRLALVAERTSNSVLIADASNRIIWVNQAFSTLSGYTPQQAQGRLASELHGAIQDPAKLSQIAHALDQGQNLRIETVNQSADGRQYWVDLDLQILRDDMGRYSGYVAVERDITADKLAQERERAHTEQLNGALRQTQALMHTINSHAIVSESDPDGRITHVNDAFCAISGYSRKQLLGQTHQIVNSGVHPQAFWADMWQTITSGKPWRRVICNRAKDGSLYWVDSIIASFQNAAGKIEKYVSIRVDITQARQNQKDLAQERLRLQNVLEGTNVGTWETNLLTLENRVDDRWARSLGYELHELMPFKDSDWRRLMHPDDYQLTLTRMREHVTGKKPYFEVESRMRHKDGRWVWVLSRARVSSRAPDGRAEWVSGTHMDITQQHDLYEQLAKNNQLMTAILQNLPCGLSVFDVELNMVTDNQVFRTLLGLPDHLFAAPVTRFEDIIRHNARRGDYGPGEVDAIVGPIVERARHPTAHQLERTRDNGVVLDIRGSPMPGGGFVTTYMDITQRKKAEQEALRSDEILRHAINTLDEAFVVYDQDDRLLLCNQRYKEVYKISAEVIAPGVSFEEVIRYGAERGQIKEAVGRVEEWVTERLRIHRAANTDMLQELDNGRFLRIIERKTSDGYIVGFRIDSTDLVRARMAAEEASRSKSQFLANMSHEIRTPMNAIRGMLKLLQGTDLNNRQLDYVQKTEGAAKSLLELLNDILDFSKVEAGKMTLEAAPFSVDHLMRELSVILSSNTSGKNVEVLFELDDKLPATLVGDSLRLKQILINLAGNAIKFTERGEVLIRIRLVRSQAGAVTLEFSVRDTGIGIAPENVARIFEGFSQAEASTTRRFGGTGLGLAISARLVSLMDGQLQLESEPGKGSNFHFTITLGFDAGAPRLVALPEQAGLHDLQVLIIDDNSVAQQVMLGMVQALGWQAEVADSGAQGLQLIEARHQAGQRQFDTVLVDWQMPGMDGWETSLQIRKRLTGASAPILLMVTAYGREMLAQRPDHAQTPLNGFLVKPVTASMLMDALADARSPSRGQERAARRSAGSPQRLQGMRVLLVEDNLLNQQVAIELLGREGAQVTLAENGLLGVQAIAAAQPPFDAVLMDVQMPVMDGYMATRKVRQELGMARLPIIAMTANAMESDRLEALAVGMNAHIGKPFDLDQLVAAMLEHSDWRPSEADQSMAASASVPLPASALIKAPPTTKEFDIPAVLDRLGGNVTILAKVLQLFARDLPHHATVLSAHLDQGQLDDARRQMHTLKGSAATVGAHRLAALAAQAEVSLRQGTSPTADEARKLRASVQAATDAVARELGPLLRQMQDQAASEQGPDKVTAAVDRAALQIKLQRLMTLLETSDMDSLHAFASLKEQHGTALAEEFEQLDEAMAALDFSQALALCETLKQKFRA